jgi:hypothetical protein
MNTHPQAAALPSADAPVIEHGALDSQTLGVRVGRLRVTDPDAAEYVTGECRQRGFDLGIATCPASDGRLVAALGRRGWRVMDTEIVFEGPVAQSEPLPPALRRRVAAARDSQAVAHLAALAFHGHISHYSADPRLSDRLASAAYADWASRMCTEKSGRTVVLLYEKDGGLAHFSACKIDGADPSRGELLLAGMNPRYQGMRMGTLVTADSIGYLHDQGAERVTAVTGATNIPSQRQLMRCSLRPREAFYVLHRWFGPSRGRGTDGTEPDIAWPGL